MKKITITLFSIIFSYSIYSQEVLNESFDTDLSLPAGWTNQSNSASNPDEIWTFSDNQDFLWLFAAGNNYMADFAGGSGNNAVFDSNAYGPAVIADTSLTSPVFDCTDLSEVKLSYGYFILSSAIGYSGSAFVEVYDGASWIVVAEYSESTIAPDANGYYWDYGEALLDVSAELAGVSNAQVRIRFSEITAQAWGMKIDNIVVQQPLGNAPDSVVGMLPEDGATNVEIMLSATGTKMIDFEFVSATTGDPATTFDFWFGTTTDVTEAVTGVLPDLDITWGTTTDSGWQPNTTYYWAIEANNVAGSTLSEVQSFTTGADDPLGTNDEVAKSFKVFPNPVEDILFIEGNSNIDEIQIINQLGQAVMKYENLRSTTQINLDKLKSGIYFVKFRAESNTEIHQIIKK